MPTAGAFKENLNRLLREAQAKGMPFVDVRAGDFHRQVSGPNAPLDRMPTCCNAMMQFMLKGDTVLERPPSGFGSNLKIRYMLPRLEKQQNSNEDNDMRISPTVGNEMPDKSEYQRFQDLAEKIMSEYYHTPLKKGTIPNVPKEFDLVSPDGSIVGDAKYFTMVKGERNPSAKMSVIAEYVWLMEKTRAKHRFLVFGNDRRVPAKWLDKHRHLAEGFEFFFLDMQTQRLEKL